MPEDLTLACTVIMISIRAIVQFPSFETAIGQFMSSAKTHARSERNCTFKSRNEHDLCVVGRVQCSQRSLDHRRATNTMLQVSTFLLPAIVVRRTSVVASRVVYTRRRF